MDTVILGAAGLTGRELLHLLSHHPELNPVHLSSDRHAGQQISSVFPEFDGLFDLTFQKHDAPLPPGAPVFLAVPNDTAMETVPPLIEAGHPLVDLSGAFRIHNRQLFEKYYRLEHSAWGVMDRVVFGIPEMFRSEIKNATAVSNPGCYATGAIIPLYLLGDLREQIHSVSVDSKSGVSGAGGRVEDAGFSFNSVHENFRAYKILKHQHTPEIIEYSSHGMNTPLRLVFTPHLLPVYRGILSTITIFWKEGSAPANPVEIFRQRSQSEPFLRVLETPEEVELRRVQHTNFMDISARTEDGVTVIVSAIDNLQKGAAGQAMQNMNLILGLEETRGIY